MNTEYRERLREIFYRWELIRIAYNAILLVTFIITIGTDIPQLTPRHYLSVGYLALAANVFFMAGPTLEAMATRLLGRNMALMRYSLFGGGLLIAVPLTILASKTMLLPLD